MKNKIMVYVLGLMVAIIWGIIIYRIVAAVDKDDEPISPAMAVLTSKEPMEDHALVKDTGTLKLNYRNPFGQSKPSKDTIQLPVKQLVHSTNVSTFRPPVPKPIINWSFIKYSGYIRNPRSKKLIALININGKSLMLSEGEAAEQVKILKNLRDSIKVAYQNHTKFIAINTGS